MGDHPSPHSHHCSGCLVSRRCFLGAAAAAAATPWLPRLAAAQPAPNSGDYVDLESLRPRPPVRVMGAIVRVEPPYWLGWPGTSYDVEQKRAEYCSLWAQAAAQVGVAFESEASPIETAEAAEQFAAKILADRPDAVVLTLQHMAAWGWADAIARSGVPTIIFAPVGTAFTGHVLEISRRRGVYVMSTLDTDAFVQALRMVRAKRQFEESRILVIAGDQRNETVLERLGTKVRYIPRDTMHERFEATPVDDETHEVARLIQQPAQRIVEPRSDDLLNAARAFQTAKRIVRDEKANALTTDCLGMVGSRLVPTPPCMAASLFQDAGITYGCEADLFGAISLMFTSFVFDKPGFMNDPVPETVRNLLVAAHCTSGSQLNGFGSTPEPVILRSHSESDLGVATQVLWREGQPVTLVRFQNANEVIVDTGVVAGNVETPPAGGCRTSVEIAMDRVEDVRDVIGFHQVVFYGNHRRDIEAFCQMYGLDVIHSPEHAPERTQA